MNPPLRPLLLCSACQCATAAHKRALRGARQAPCERLCWKWQRTTTSISRRVRTVTAGRSTKQHKYKWLTHQALQTQALRPHPRQGRCVRYQGLWQCGHADLPDERNHLSMHAPWKRLAQVWQASLGSWPLVGATTA